DTNRDLGVAREELAEEIDPEDVTDELFGTEIEDSRRTIRIPAPVSAPPEVGPPPSVRAQAAPVSSPKPPPPQPPTPPASTRTGAPAPPAPPARRGPPPPPPRPRTPKPGPPKGPPPPFRTRAATGQSRRPR